MKLLLLLLLLPGCASLQTAGVANYSVAPFVDADGITRCCAVSVKNGKEFAWLELHIDKSGENYKIDLYESGVAAFEGQRISKDALREAVAVGVKAALAVLK